MLMTDWSADPGFRFAQSGLRAPSGLRAI